MIQSAAVDQGQFGAMLRYCCTIVTLLCITLELKLLDFVLFLIQSYYDPKVHTLH